MYIYLLTFKSTRKVLVLKSKVLQNFSLKSFFINSYCHNLWGLRMVLPRAFEEMYRWKKLGKWKTFLGCSLV